MGIEPSWRWRTSRLVEWFVIRRAYHRTAKVPAAYSLSIAVVRHHKQIAVRLFIVSFILYWQSVYAQPQNRYTDSLHTHPTQQLITELDFKNTDLKDIIRTLATKYNLNIFVDDDVKTRLTLHLVNVTVADALQFIVEDNDLVLRQYGSIYKIGNPPPPEEPPKEWNIFYSNGRLSVDFKEEDVREVINQLSKITGKTIMMDKGVNGSVSGIVHQLEFEEALYQLLKNNGFLLQKEGNVYRVRRYGMNPGEEGASHKDFWVHVHGSQIDLEVNEVPLPQVLNEISRQMGVSFFYVGNVQGKTSARAMNLSLERCLSYLFVGNDYTYKKSDDIYLIGEKTNKGLVTSRLIKLKHLKVDGITEILPARVISKAELTIVKEHNALLINGSHDVINEVQDIVYELDHPIAQILIEALVIDYNFQDFKELSVEMGKDKYDPSRGSYDTWLPEVDILWSGDNANKYLDKITDHFGVRNVVKLPPDFYVRVKALESVGKVNIRSRPLISTLNGYPADIKIGQTQYFKLVTQTPIRDPSQVYIQTTERFQTIEANVSLQITPWVSASGEITTEIHPEFNTPVGQLSPDIPPTIQSRSLNSTIKLRDGETIILGGLIQDRDMENISRVPLLGSIPLLGQLFSSKNWDKSKSELIIYVTPHLSYADDLIMEPRDAKY